MSGDTKERILEAALDLFAQSGYLGTSMSDIAKQLGITKGALYKHYKSKQEILNCIVERMNQDRKIVLLKIIEQAAESDKWSTYVERVRRWLIEQAKVLNLYSP